MISVQTVKRAIKSKMRFPFWNEPLADLPAGGRLFGILLGLGIVLSHVPAAHSDEGRYQDYVFGARAIALGGAFTAISNDASGLFYNPAGLVDVSRSNLSIATSFYGIELGGQNLEENANILSSGGISAADLIILPSASGGVIGLGKPLANGSYRHAVAFGTAVPKYTYRVFSTPLSALEQDDNGVITHYRTSLVDRSLHAGGGYAYRPSPWLRMGTSLQYVLRTLDATEGLNSYEEANTRSFLSSNSHLRATNHSLRSSLGLKLHLGARWLAGFSITTPSLGLYESVSLESYTVSGAPNLPPSSLTPILFENDAAIGGSGLGGDDRGNSVGSQQPGFARLGMAFVQPSSYTFAMDLTAYAPNRYNLLPLRFMEDVYGDRSVQELLKRIPISMSVSRRAVANINVGFEKLFGGNKSVSAGFFTDYSSAPELTVDENGFLPDGENSRLANLDMLGMVLSYGQFSEHTLGRYGVMFSTGRGNVVASSDPSGSLGEGLPPLAVNEVTETFVYFFISSSFRYSKARQ